VSDAQISEIPRRRVGAIDFSVLPLTQAIALIVEIGSKPPEHGLAVHFANAYNVALADTDADYRDLINAGDLVFSDGTPVVWAGRRLHRAISTEWTRVYGPDVLTGVLDGSTPKGPRHYLLGSTPETLALLMARIASTWADAQVVGSESPPFRAPTEDELAERDRRIAESGATLVWVGLGTPKQDIEVRRLADSIPVTALAVGAAFDFLAGTVSQAPEWMQRSGLEWTYRLAQEPKRLAKRYLWGNPRFMLSVAKQASHRASPER
jgi:N-acetylglucosaminyldiphosphoundecaprenol N-acetyl-beta-D-mannosaminyltransferase